MNNATDTAVSSFFSDEAERIKKRSWTSLWIGFAVAVPCVLIIIPGFFLLFIVPLWGALILFASFVGFVVGMVFILPTSGARTGSDLNENAYRRPDPTA